MSVLRTIHLTKGTGEARTKLAAFDQALHNAGIANYNLIGLSSVIPEGVTIKRSRPKLKSGEFGYRLYVVYISAYATEAGKEAWAGLGWMMKDDKKGGGVLVEHRGESRKEVLQLIQQSLTSMRRHRKERYGKINHAITGITSKNRPVCAVVAVIYQSQPWDV